MLEKLAGYLATHFPVLKEKKLMLAVSGGIDSMVMIDLFRKLNCQIAIVHCNFQLRGKESFDDEAFLKNFADQAGIPIYITHFDTKAFADDYKLSTQLAARELRYNWFYELLETHEFDFLLTAHHADDNLETFLINLSRGTGLEGLIGIPIQNEKVIRPLLYFSRDEIESYARENDLQWREDSSNAGDEYLRNKIRHHVVPSLKEINSDFLSAFQKTLGYLNETQILAEDASIMVYQQIAQEANGEIHFNLKKLKQLPNYRSYLYQWLKEFGFTAWNDVYNLAEGQSGKQIFSPSHRLIKNREFFILAPLPESHFAESYEIADASKDVNFPLKISFCKTADISLPTNSAIFVDEEKMRFPLVLRRWKAGDSFQPLGMNGQSKKVSKFFKDEKMSLTEKENAWLLCSDDRIVWLVGIRQDERFKANPNTQQILKIALTP